MKIILLNLIFGCITFCSFSQFTQNFRKEFETSNGIYGYVNISTKPTTVGFGYIWIQQDAVIIEGINSQGKKISNNTLSNYGVNFPFNCSNCFFTADGQGSMVINGTGYYGSFNKGGIINSGGLGKTNQPIRFSERAKQLHNEAVNKFGYSLWERTGKVQSINIYNVKGADLGKITRALKKYNLNIKKIKQFNNLISQANNTQNNEQKLDIFKKAKQYASKSQLNDLRYKISEINRSIKVQKEKEEKERLAKIENERKAKESSIEKTNSIEKVNRKNKHNATEDDATEDNENYEEVNVAAIQQNHQAKLKAIKEKHKKIVYKNKIDYAYKMIDLRTQQLLNSGLDDYHISYGLNDLGIKKNALAKSEYYKAQQEKILNNYKYNNTNKTVAIASSIVSSIQEYSEQQRLKNQRAYLRRVYEERIDFQRAFNYAQRSLEGLDQVVNSYLKKRKDFSYIKNEFKELYSDIKKVNKFDFKYWKEHKDIGDMFFNNSNKLKNLFEKLYLTEFSRVKNNLEKTIDLYLIYDSFYNKLSDETKKYLADYVASELSKKEEGYIFNKIINNQTIIDRSYSDQKKYYSEIITKVSKTKKENQVLSYLNNTNNNTIALALLETNIKVNDEEFYQKYKSNYLIQNFIRNNYNGQEIIVLEPIQSKNKLKLARNLKSGLLGYINSKNKWIIKPKFKTAKPFLNKNTVVAEQKIGIDYDYFTIDSKGKILKRIKDTNILPLKPFKNGYAVATKKNGKLKGYINQNFKWVVRPKYVKAESVVNGKAKVKTLSGKYKTIKL